MPKNPSAKQIEASKKNLKGHHGPKTRQGKLASSRNGKKNRGPITTKSKAILINARWGIKDTLYERSNCLHCDKDCQGKSFSRDAPLSKYSFECFREVVTEYHAECFYYFEGLCGIRYYNPELPISYCILDDPKLLQFSSHLESSERYNKELECRKEFVRLKTELKNYLKMANNEEYTEEIQNILRQLKQGFSSGIVCKLDGRQLLLLEEQIQNLVFNITSYRKNNL